ncbi:MAG: hypothetical protein HQL77_10520 [Magnetococcales bacterium]|nr:hypothetical protein [Magnetococcales bacterium]
MEKTWIKAIKKVLADPEYASGLHYTEITEQIFFRGLYETDGATPAATVRAQINSSIKHKGSASPFIKIGPGVFALRTTQSNQIENLDDTELEERNSAHEVPELESNSMSIIRSFGMYWHRELIVWRADPKLLGKQSTGSKQVDFCKQKGIYILYDHHSVIYVGRSIDRPLGKRLFEHTVDRLGSRWNRFSWFGLLNVAKDGNLREVQFNSSASSLITSLESLLIEALEPPLNRKRGENFSEYEYIQDIDQELRERDLQHTLRLIETKLRGQSE